MKCILLSLERQQSSRRQSTRVQRGGKGERPAQLPELGGATGCLPGKPRWPCPGCPLPEVLPSLEKNSCWGGYCWKGSQLPKSFKCWAIPDDKKEHLNLDTGTPAPIHQKYLIKMLVSWVFIFGKANVKGGADILTHFERTIPIHNQLSSCCSTLKENNWMGWRFYLAFISWEIILCTLSLLWWRPLILVHGFYVLALFYHKVGWVSYCL